MDDPPGIVRRASWSSFTEGREARTHRGSVPLDVPRQRLEKLQRVPQQRLEKLQQRLEKLQMDAPNSGGVGGYETTSTPPPAC
jgi:hypothetical protein